MSDMQLSSIATPITSKSDICPTPEKPLPTAIPVTSKVLGF